MQPDTWTFLLSARRELELASTSNDGTRAVYLKRAALILERLAFFESGLADALTAAIPEQEALLSEFQKWIREPSAESDRQKLTVLQRYERNNLELQRLLEGAGSDLIHLGLAEASALDSLVRKVSTFTYRLNQTIAAEGHSRAQAWEAHRPSVSLAAVTAERLTDYLRLRFPEHPGLRVTQVTKLIGMNANEAFFIDLEGHPAWPVHLILRRSLAAQIQPTSITEEFFILEALHGTPVPVPRPIFYADDPSVVGRPFVALERLAGRVLTLTEMGDRGRPIFLKLAALLGRLHALDSKLLPEFRRANGESALQWLNRRIDNWEREWRRGAREPVLTVTAAFYWLRRHAGTFVDQQVIVHGDLDQRNVLVEGDDIIALIDWEVAHQGHPAEDLAYLREHVQSVMPWDEFVAEYEANGGKQVTEEQLRYGTVLSNMLRVTTSMIAHAAYVDGVIDNFLMGSVRTIETEAACQRLHQAIHGSSVEIRREG